jgi:hypothetical protein
VVTALAELQQMRGLHRSTFQVLAALRMEIFPSGAILELLIDGLDFGELNQIQ